MLKGVAPAQSIFRIKFCPGLGIFLFVLRGEKCPGPSPSLDFPGVVSHLYCFSAGDNGDMFNKLCYDVNSICALMF